MSISPELEVGENSNPRERVLNYIPSMYRQHGLLQYPLESIDESHTDFIEQLTARSLALDSVRHDTLVKIKEVYGIESFEACAATCAVTLGPHIDRIFIVLKQYALKRDGHVSPGKSWSDILGEEAGENKRDEIVTGLEGAITQLENNGSLKTYFHKNREIHRMFDCFRRLMIERNPKALNRIVIAMDKAAKSQYRRGGPVLMSMPSCETIDPDSYLDNPPVLAPELMLLLPDRQEKKYIEDLARLALPFIARLKPDARINVSRDILVGAPVLQSGTDVLWFAPGEALYTRGFTLYPHIKEALLRYELALSEYFSVPFDKDLMYFLYIIHEMLHQWKVAKDPRFVEFGVTGTAIGVLLDRFSRYEDKARRIQIIPAVLSFTSPDPDIVRADLDNNHKSVDKGYDVNTLNILYVLFAYHVIFFDKGVLKIDDNGDNFQTAASMLRYLADRSIPLSPNSLESDVFAQASLTDEVQKICICLGRYIDSYTSTTKNIQ
jgi:hypothetical protein